MVSPFLSADIFALIRRYLRSCWQISSPVAFHIPIHSANGYAMNFLMNTPRDKLKIHAAEDGNKDFIPYLYARKQGRGGGGFHFFGVLIAFAICSCEVKRRKFQLYKSEQRSECSRICVGIFVHLYWSFPTPHFRAKIAHAVCL